MQHYIEKGWARYFAWVALSDSSNLKYQAVMTPILREKWMMIGISYYFSSNENLSYLIMIKLCQLQNICFEVNFVQEQNFV